MSNNCPSCQQDFKQYSAKTNRFACMLCKTQWTTREHRVMPCQKCGQEIDCNIELDMDVNNTGPWHDCKCDHNQSSRGVAFKSIVTIVNDKSDAKDATEVSGVKNDNKKSMEAKAPPPLGAFMGSRFGEDSFVTAEHMAAVKATTPAQLIQAHARSNKAHREWLRALQIASNNNTPLPKMPQQNKIDADIISFAGLAETINWYIRELDMPESERNKIIATRKANGHEDEPDNIAADHLSDLLQTYTLPQIAEIVNVSNANWERSVIRLIALQDKEMENDQVNEVNKSLIISKDKIVFADHKIEKQQEKLADTSVLLGKTLEEARQLYKNIRVVEKDGVGLFVHDDANTYRLNVATTLGRISKVLNYI